MNQEEQNLINNVKNLHSKMDEIDARLLTIKKNLEKDREIFSSSNLQSKKVVEPFPYIQTIVVTIISLVLLISLGHSIGIIQ
jgi:hypothetical protein